jgi:DNA-binding MarR family transcriptional regulator
MLLELYVAHLIQRRLSVTDVCRASRVPHTTALRWIDVLAAKELVCRKKDPLDARRIFIDLTSSGSNALQHYFEAISNRVWPVESARMGLPLDAPTPAVAM